MNSELDTRKTDSNTADVIGTNNTTALTQAMSKHIRSTKLWVSVGMAWCFCFSIINFLFFTPFFIDHISIMKAIIKEPIDDASVKCCIVIMMCVCQLIFARLFYLTNKLP